VTKANWDHGRAAQKLRTRQALMDTAVELVKAGRRPSVSAVADQAGVSRATAYRYFPSQELMLSEAAIRAGAPDGLRPLGIAAATPEEVAAAVTRQAGEYALDHEERMRAGLRLSLDPHSGYRRPGRRVQWVDEILAAAGDRLDPAIRARLAAALNLLIGIDPIISLTDVAGLDRAAALDVLEWVAATLVEAAIRESADAERPASAEPDSR
jgi:AcrR family transcriptional regulator